MDKLSQTIMDGLIKVAPRVSDWVFQKLSGIVHEVRNSTRDWIAFRPSAERQSGRRVDVMACVSFSIANVVEETVNWMNVNGLLPKWNKDGLAALGFFDTGEFNISDRDVAQGSGTTREGNWFVRVLDHMRKNGFVAESKWTSVIPEGTWDEYYQTPPIEVLALRKEVLKYLEIVYQRIELDIYAMSKALEHSPLAISIPGHAICCDSIDVKNKTVSYLDSYEPFSKTVPFSRLSDAQYGVVVSPIKEGGGTMRPKHVFTRSINPGRKIPGEQSSDVVALQQILEAPVTGIYDNDTRVAVFSFQLNHVLPINPAWLWEILTLQGRSAGPKTIRALNLM